MHMNGASISSVGWCTNVKEAAPLKAIEALSLRGTIGHYAPLLRPLYLSYPHLPSLSCIKSFPHCQLWPFQTIFTVFFFTIPKGFEQSSQTYLWHQSPTKLMYLSTTGYECRNLVFKCGYKTNSVPNAHASHILTILNQHLSCSYKPIWNAAPFMKSLHAFNYPPLSPFPAIRPGPGLEMRL